MSRFSSFSMACNMGWLVDALLLAVVLTEVKTLIPPWSFIALNTYQNGEAINLIDWGWTSLPSSDFSLAFWVYVSTATSSDPSIVYIQSGSESSKEFFWNNDGLLMWDQNPFFFVGSPAVVSRTTYTYKAWFHLVITTSGSSLCEVLTLRVGAQNQRCAPAISLLSTTTIIAPYIYSDSFIVKSM